MTTEHYDQLRTTLGVLRSRRSTEVPGTMHESLAAGGPQLLALARAVDPENAEVLFQTAYADVLERSGTAELRDVMERLAELAEQQRETEIRTEPVRADRITEISDTGPDENNPSELYFPAFYEEPTALGDWVDSPNSWPEDGRILGPDAEIDTEELYGVVDAALAQLPDEHAMLLELVDVQDVPADVAARTCGLDQASAGRVLGQARHHVRRRLHDYLDGTESS